MIPAIWYVAPFGAVMALIFAFILFRNVKNQDPGNAQMQKIAKHVREGAFAYLKQQYKGVTIFFVAAFITFNFISSNVLRGWLTLKPIASRGSFATPVPPTTASGGTPLKSAPFSSADKPFPKTRLLNVVIMAIIQLL